jgi:predicted nucleotidyltransferase component of viral defense system
VKAPLPALPDRTLLADLSRETAELERVQPELVEKDFYLTRLLWALGEELGDGLLLKGETLLSKVDIGFLRMSDDADLVIPGTADRSRASNARQLNRVRDALRSLAPQIGVRIEFPGGEYTDRAAHAIWQVDYESRFRTQNLRIEVSIRPLLRPPRHVSLRRLLTDPLAGDHGRAGCWALSADEARAEKVRSAFTREEIRDYYDLDRLIEADADFDSDAFIALVDAKLAELNQRPLEMQPPSFALTATRRRNLEAALGRELPAMLRPDAPPFDLERMLEKFDRVWKK